MRLKFSKQDAPLLEHFSKHLRAMDHVSDVQVRPDTSSLIIQHDPEAADFVALLQDFVREGTLFFLEGEADAKSGVAHLTAVERDAHYLVEHSRLGESMIRYAEHLNRAVKELTDGWIDLRILLPATAAVCALLVIQVDSSPMWVPLALFAYQAFVNLHQPTTVRVQVPAGLESSVPVTLDGRV